MGERPAGDENLGFLHKKVIVEVAKSLQRRDVQRERNKRKESTF